MGAQIAVGGVLDPRIVGNAACSGRYDPEELACAALRDAVDALLAAEVDVVAASTPTKTRSPTPSSDALGSRSSTSRRPTGHPA